MSICRPPKANANFAFRILRQISLDGFSEFKYIAIYFISVLTFDTDRFDQSLI